MEKLLLTELNDLVDEKFKLLEIMNNINIDKDIQNIKYINNKSKELSNKKKSLLKNKLKEKMILLMKTREFYRK